MTEWLGLLAGVMFLGMLIWTYLMWVDLKRLRAIAMAFGEGDFTVRSRLSERSPLYYLATSLDQMAERIQKLMISHKELTDAVSHELRTPVARLRFGMAMLQSSEQEQERQRYIQGIYQDIDELEQLVGELLNHARSERGRPNLKYQCLHVESWLRRQLKKARLGLGGIGLEYQVKGGRYASFEPESMARALTNLIQNAKRYASHRINVIFEQRDGDCLLIVDDDGPGIPMQEQKSIFDAFVRLDQSSHQEMGGFGLGLAIAQRISHNHDGDISVAVSPMGGARFVICWPKAIEPSNGPLNG